MAKTLASSIHLTFYQAEGDNMICKVNYGVSAEDLNVNRITEISLTQVEKNVIKNFVATKVIPGLKVFENITP